MRIGVLTTSYPRHPGDYAGSFVADRVADLVAAGHAVEVLAAGDGAPAVVDGASVVRLPSGRALFYQAGAPEALEQRGAALWWAAARFSTALAATARIRARGWDAIESHWLIPCALGASAAAPWLARVAYAHSGDVALLERLRFGRALSRRLARDGTRLRFVSAELRERFRLLAGLAADVGTVEPLAVSPSLFPRRSGPDPELRRRLGLTGPTVLAVGRLVPIKGHELLLHACARLAATSPGPKPGVIILGDGPERAPLSRLAGALGVSLRLPGFVSRPQVAAYLRAADVYVQASIRLPNGRCEGAPTATREAFSSGVPVVAASEVGSLLRGLREHLDNVTERSTARNDLRSGA